MTTDKKKNIFLSRVEREFKEFDDKSKDEFTLKKIDDDMHKWLITFVGSKDSMYHGFTFGLCFTLKDEYPFTAPDVLFKNEVYHPNVGLKSKKICIDILKDKWTPVYDMITIARSIKSLLDDPNITDPLNLEAATLYDNKDEYLKRIKETMNESFLKS